MLFRTLALRRLTPGALAGVLLIGCSPDPAPSASTSPASLGTGSEAPANPSTTAGSPTETQHSDGISAEEAQEQQVFVGPFDARLTLVARSPDSVIVELTNVGTSSDEYRLELDDPTATVEPSTVELEPGQSARVVIAEVPQGRLTAVSSGRNDRIAVLDF